MNKRKKKSLFERQFETVSRRFKITREEFREYYDNLRRANKKGQRIKNNVKAKLYVPKFSYTTAALRTREDFEHYRNSVNFVLQKDYRKKTNERMRLQIRDNIYNAFGSTMGAEIMRRFDAMDDATSNRFLSDPNNSDWQTVAYDSKTNILEWIDLSVADLDYRIQKFNEKNS